MFARSIACFVACAIASPAIAADDDRARALSAVCGDFARFTAVARETARGPEAVDQKRATAALVSLYLERCGLTETIDLTNALIEFPTVSAREPASTGESFRAMAAFLADWSKKAGLDFRNAGANDAWEIGYGKGAPSVGFVMHGDVVPIDDGVDAKTTAGKNAIDKLTGEPLPQGWTKAPFRGTVADGKLYGRGSEDDKGPIAAVMVVMRAMSKLGLEPTGRVLAIIGTGEEHDWTGMRRYVEALSPKPAFVISVDANFPVVIAESGFVAWELSAPIDAPSAAVMGARAKAAKCSPVIDAKAGLFLTQVPGEAMLAIAPAKGETIAKLRARVEAATKAPGEGLRFEHAVAGEKLELRAFGEAVHSSVADEGKNALWALATAAEKLQLCPGGVTTLLAVVARKMSGDHWGKQLGLAYEHPQMGKLLVVPTLLRVEGGVAKLGVNMRRPAGITSADFGKKLDAVTASLVKEFGGGLKESGERYVGEPALADIEGPLVSTLLDIYKNATGDRAAKPISVRGGTYARLFPGAVSFGPQLPGQKYRGHAPDEYIELDTLRLLLRVNFEAILELGPKAKPAAANPKP